jgi:hypothetical protein
MARTNDSIAEVKSWRLNETIANKGHTIIPNTVAAMTPSMLAYGNGANPNDNGRIF